MFLNFVIHLSNQLLYIPGKFYSFFFKFYPKKGKFELREVRERKSPFKMVLNMNTLLNFSQKIQIKTLSNDTLQFPITILSAHYFQTKLETACSITMNLHSNTIMVKEMSISNFRKTLLSYISYLLLPLVFFQYIFFTRIKPAALV